MQSSDIHALSGEEESESPTIWIFVLLHMLPAQLQDIAALRNPFKTTHRNIRIG